MPKVNTILNYFTSPKTVKKPEAAKEEREKSQTPKREQKNKGSTCKNYFLLKVHSRSNQTRRMRKK